MVDIVQSQLYFERMESSLGDKSAITQFLNPGSVIDVGAGSGMLSEHFRATGFKTIALDDSYTAIDEIHKNYPQIQTVKANAENFVDSLPHQVNNVVFSSVLHEVYSYGNGLKSVKNALRNAWESLEIDGRLVIRDGVKPDNPHGNATVLFKTEDGVKFAEFFTKNSPFSEILPLRISHTTPNLWRGTRQSVMELLYTYTWGWEGSAREVQELYGILTEDDYVELVESLGFKVTFHQQYLQPGYPYHLSNKVFARDEDTWAEFWPASNFILVAEKR